MAGALASVSSRTVTAPLDRLKVFLIAQTATSEAAAAWKQRHPAVALTNSLASFGRASRALWQAGGIYSLWAGKL